MPNYRRYRVAGGTYFFKLKMERNAPIFKDARNVRLLGEQVGQAVPDDDEMDRHRSSGTA